MKPRLISLLQTIQQLGESSDVVTYVDLVRLAGLLARDVGVDLAEELVALLYHPNTNARRVALLALKRARWWSSEEIICAVVRCLDDASAIVRLDALTAVEAGGLRTPNVLDALGRLAGDSVPIETTDEDDLVQLVRIRAWKLLARLAERTRS